MMMPLHVFRSAPKLPGIYMIFNTISGKVYVGQASRLRTRLGRHYNELVSGKHSNKHLSSSWNRHGQDAFRYIILDVFNMHRDNKLLKECLRIAEQFWLDQWPQSLRYTTAPLASSCLGVRHTTESRLKMGAKAGKPLTTQHKERISAGKLGGKHTAATREKMSEARRLWWSVAKPAVREAALVQLAGVRIRPGSKRRVIVNVRNRNKEA